ncbi:hypothetical protein ACHAXA_000901 [Cyclostephanos tholiformis]|uniref:Uncharacterized protein n=1 Tax=Cyclostephanos tholiformis TaxID=382380 RepID=A0ABD3R3V8_9STRA
MSVAMADACTVAESVLTDEMSEAGLLRRQKQQQLMIHRRGRDLKMKAEELQRRKDAVEAAAKRRQQKQEKEEEEKHRPQQQPHQPSRNIDQLSLPSSEVDLASLGRLPSIDLNAGPHFPVVSLRPSAQKVDDDDVATIGEGKVKEGDAAARSAGIGGRSDQNNAASTDVVAATIRWTCETTNTANSWSNTNKVEALTCKVDASTPIDEVDRDDTFMEQIVENAVHEATWMRREHQSKRQWMRRHGQSLPGLSPATSTALASSLPSASATPAESPIARWPPVHPNIGRRPTRFFPITSPTSSAATRFSGEISPPLVPPSDATTTMADDNPITALSYSSPILEAKPGLTSSTPFDEALPARSPPITLAPTIAGNGMAEHCTRLRTTDVAAANAPATSTAGQWQQYLHRYHQAEPSPSQCDHSADNAMGVGNGIWRKVLSPSPLMNPISSALTAVVASPRSVIQSSSNENFSRRPTTAIFP